MIEVGITEFHGIADEYSKFPPEGINYSPVEPTPRFTNYIFKSRAKGVLDYFYSKNHDLLEAPLFPILTDQPWIFTPARFTSGTSFNLFGIDVPRNKKLQDYYLKKSMSASVLKWDLWKEVG